MFSSIHSTLPSLWVYRGLIWAFQGQSACSEPTKNPVNTAKVGRLRLAKSHFNARLKVSKPIMAPIANAKILVKSKVLTANRTGA